MRTHEGDGKRGWTMLPSGGSLEFTGRGSSRTGIVEGPNDMLTDMTPAAAGQLYPQLQSIAKSPAHGHVQVEKKDRFLGSTATVAFRRYPYEVPIKDLVGRTN
uniref:Uncharacterized protein n=1 Tax=Vespula pensylvanica TaxID=30213 RepID=A0A834U929_VESPE|nr:hypothetical protein H0235_008635 [Vespula pensylvanica]